MTGLSLVLVPRSVRFAPSRSLFLCVNRTTVFELIILVPRARDPSGLHQGSRTLTVPNFWALALTCTGFSFCIFKPIRFVRFDNESVNRGLAVLEAERGLDSWRRAEGSSYFLPPFENESTCEAIHMKMPSTFTSRPFSCKSNLFLFEWFRTETRFESEAKGNSELAYRPFALGRFVAPFTDHLMILLENSCSLENSRGYMNK